MKIGNASKYFFSNFINFIKVILFTVLEIANGEYGNFNEFLNSKIRSQHYFENKPPVQNIEEPPLLPCGKMNIAVNKPHEMYKFSVLFKRCVMQQYRDWVS